MRYSYLLCATLAFQWAWAGDTSVSAEVRTAMNRSSEYMRSISVGGGYLWTYSLDLSRRAGEGAAPHDVIWFESPGTGAMGEAFLRAWQATGDLQLLKAARGTVEALAKCQLGSGGWHYSGSMNPEIPNGDNNLDFKGLVFQKEKPSEPIYPLYRMATTFDDDVTQNCTRFLIRFVAATKDSSDSQDVAARVVLDKALRGIINAQYPNGGWPERYFGEPREASRYPVQKAVITDDWRREWPKEQEADYMSYYTLNDRCQRDCIDTLLLAWQMLGREDCLAAAKKGGDFLILAQFPEPQAGWASVYDFDMRPAWGRSWEVPGLSSCESRTALEALLSLYLETGEEKYLAPIAPAVAWLERSMIAPNTWARFYEMGSNQPIYGDRDGRIHRSLDEVSPERKNGYGWQGNFGISDFLTRYEAVKRMGRAAVQERMKPRPVNAAEVVALEAKVQTVIAGLDAEGRWISRGSMGKGPEEDVISTKVFISNLDLMSRYLQATKTP